MCLLIRPSTQFAFCRQQLVWQISALGIGLSVKYCVSGEVGVKWSSLMFAKCKCFLLFETFWVVTNELKGTAAERTHNIKGLDSQVFRLQWFQFWISDDVTVLRVAIENLEHDKTNILLPKHLICFFFDFIQGPGDFFSLLGARQMWSIW